MAFSPTSRQLAVLRIIVFTVALVPLCRLIYGAANDGLGANPIEFITRASGT
jgi:sulfoxide reductase heme-binding subunit YedZ